MNTTIPSFDRSALNLLEIVRQQAKQQQPIYLVGGALRDHLLGRKIKDLDFALVGDTGIVSRAVKRALAAQVFILDDTRQTARVIHRTEDGEIIHLDFVKFTGETLVEDLENRDFSINALAVDLSRLDFLVDPLGGWDDLKQKILRVCSEHAMQDDPLRVLRGIRLVLKYDLTIDVHTTDLMVDAAPDIKRISGERVRDELINILALGKPRWAFQLFDRIGCIEPVFPELAMLKQVPAVAPHVHDLWEHTLNVAEYLNLLMDAILSNSPDLLQQLPFFEALESRIWEFNDKLRDHFLQDIQPERSRKSLLLLAALYHDAGKPTALQEAADRRLHFYGHAKQGLSAISSRAIALALSNREVELLAGVVGNHMRVHELAANSELPSAKSIYRFFQDCGDYGIDICLLSLADMLATFEETLATDRWTKELDVVRMLMNAYWHHEAEIINPPKLMSGDDLQTEFNLTPGPIFKEILDALHEEQAAGIVLTRAEALDWVRQYLDRIPFNR